MSGRADQRRRAREIREVFMQVAIYCGCRPQSMLSRNAREVFAELDQKK